jgi:hypothetical protein
MASWGAARRLGAAGRLEATDVVVLGDHRFVAVSRRCLPNDALRAAGLLQVDAAGRVTGATVRWRPTAAPPTCT